MPMSSCSDAIIVTDLERQVANLLTAFHEASREIELALTCFGKCVIVVVNSDGDRPGLEYGPLKMLFDDEPKLEFSPLREADRYLDWLDRARPGAPPPPLRRNEFERVTPPATSPLYRRMCRKQSWKSAATG